jgi:adenylylsulfate kinase-like enzyme
MKKLQKWVIEECGKRDGVDYSHLYKKAIRKKLSDFIGDDEAA